MDVKTLAQVIAVFSSISILSIGGGNVTIPEMHHDVVEQHHWLTDIQFTSCYAIAQAAPGPNSLIVGMLGYGAAGVPGLFLALAAMTAPAAVLTYLASKIWQNSSGSEWHKILQRALVPIGIGLIFASGILIMRVTDHGWLGWTTTVVATFLFTKTKVHPLILMAIAAGMGLAGWI